MSIIKRNKLFNEQGDQGIKYRKLVGGNSTNLFELNNIKYDWAMGLYRAMMNNFWIPEEIPLGNDIKCYQTLTESERGAFNKVLSFLVFLDSLQTANLPNITKYITAPEVNLCLAIQTSQEAIHSQSYGYILDTIVNPQERENIYNLWRKDKFLLSRNKVITEIYDKFDTNPNDDNFIMVVMANYILEGIYFYSGFAFFYTLARQEKMTGVAQEIRYINRDELSHLVLFQRIMNTLRTENPEFFTQERQYKLVDLMRSAVESEIEWGKYIIQDGIMGLNETLITQYIQHLSNKRMKAIGLPEIYAETSNPMAWLDSFSNINGIKTDFFEAKPTAYSKASSIDWGDLD